MFKSVIVLGISLTIAGLVWGGLFSTDQARSYIPESHVEDGKKFIPIDILSSQVEWAVSSDLKQISAEAKVRFKTLKKGYPYLLLNPNAKATMSGESWSLRKLTSSEFSKSNYFAVMNELGSGDHEVTFKYSFQHDPLTMKHFLPLQYYLHKFAEMGAPGNALFDRYPLSLKISIEGDGTYEVFANAQVKIANSRQFMLDFPDYFTSMSFYIDIVKSDEVLKEEISLKSMDGRGFKAIVYSNKQDKAAQWISTFRGILEYTFYELEKKLGSYPQETLILKISDKEVGGGAYAGAMVLSSDYMEHLSHEMGHSWFLHSVTPSNGADSWIYEGFGDWAPLFGARSGFARDLNFKDSVVLSKGKYALWATQEIFTKTNIRNPHQTGSALLASIDQFLKQSGKSELKEGLMPVLKKIAAGRRHQTMSTMDFKGLLEKYTSLDFDEFFEFYFVE